MSDKLTGVDEHQPLPTKNDQPAIQDLVMEDLRRVSTSLNRDPQVVDYAYDQVIADIEARKQIGLQRYGTLLQAFNGRDCLMDAYQEALDLMQYLRQVDEEGVISVLGAYANALAMALHLRTLIEDRTNEDRRAALGDPARGD